ncbi:hypothetical protein BS78_02G384100 [Paspalum vaginatum]|nr:hypothetical protein BS78_02G384100 [Paspalum vaginatum]
MDRYNDIIHIDNGCLYMEATAVSGRVCLSANQALMMASLLQDSSAAGLTMNLGGAPPPNEISPDTIHATLRAYVKIFVDAADASYSRTVTKKTITSFLGALRGLSSISHILLHTALEALSNTHPTTGMSEYALNCDVKAMRHEFNQKMDDLENGIDKASSGIEICKLAMPVIMESTKTTGSFVALMVARRKRALAKAHTEAALVV